MLGTGDSEGICLGEHLRQEQEDALAVIDWLAGQPWCLGRVGMIGISWGGFNGLQVAALRPPALGAVVTLCSTDDRYADDIHFMGDAVLTDKLAWGATTFSIANTPPDAEIVGAAVVLAGIILAQTARVGKVRLWRSIAPACPDSSVHCGYAGFRPSQNTEQRRLKPDCYSPIFQGPRSRFW